LSLNDGGGGMGIFADAGYERRELALTAGRATSRPARCSRSTVNS